jgi:hypothetical protein
LPALAGAAAVLALLLLAWNFNLQSREAALRVANEALSAQLAILEQRLLEQEQLLAVLPGSESFPVSGTESRPAAAAQLVVAGDGRTAVLFARDLQPLADDQAYQLWFIGGEGPVGQGTFTVDEQGQGTLVVESAAAVRTYDAIGVSIEPAEGSSQPSGDIVLLGEIPPLGDSQ